jgi:hypothetical protein
MGLRPTQEGEMAQTNFEWVAQVSRLRPGCSGEDSAAGRTQVS